MKQRNKTSYRTGLYAEALCRFVLRLKLWRILKSRYRSGFGEVDIIALHGQTLAMIEVKARRTHDEALESLHAPQRKRLEKAARAFLAHHPQFNHHVIRFDLMLVTPWGWPVHLKNAWQADPQH